MRPPFALECAQVVVGEFAEPVFVEFGKLPSASRDTSTRRDRRSPATVAWPTGSRRRLDVNQPPESTTM